jgi:hypothetical protein
MPSGKPDSDCVESSIASPSIIYPNWDFWLENMPSGNPDSDYEHRMCRKSVDRAAEKSRVATPLQMAKMVYQINGAVVIAENRVWVRAGLPDFSWYKIPKREKIDQITTNYTKCP